MLFFFFFLTPTAVVSQPAVVSQEIESLFINKDAFTWDEILITCDSVSALNIAKHLEVIVA